MEERRVSDQLLSFCPNSCIPVDSKPMPKNELKPEKKREHNTSTKLKRKEKASYEAIKTQPAGKEMKQS
jgi:hypothetical protein